jgi:hypothetical protein
MYLYIWSIGKGVKNPQIPLGCIYRLPIPLVCVRFFCRGGCVNVTHEGRGLNLTIGQLFCQFFFGISIFWR